MTRLGDQRESRAAAALSPGGHVVRRYDPWRFGQAAQELEREGLLVVAFPSTARRMIPAGAGSHSAIVEQRLTVPEEGPRQ